MKIFNIILFFVVILASGGVMAIDVCEQEWLKMHSNSEGKSQEQMLDEWLRKERACGGEWFFGYKKARLIMATGDFVRAKQVALNEAKKYKDTSPFELVIFTIDRLSAIAANKLEPALQLALEKNLLSLSGKVISSYPEYYYELATVMHANGKVDEVVLYAEKGLQEGENIPLLRVLALGYEQQKNYPEVVKVLDRMFALDTESMLQNKEILLLSARAHAAVDRMDLAKIAIVQASEISDQDLSDPDVQATIQWIKIFLSDKQ